MSKEQKALEEIREQFKTGKPFASLKAANLCINMLRADIQEIIKTIPKSFHRPIREGGGLEDPVMTLAVSISKYVDYQQLWQNLRALDLLRKSRAMYAADDDRAACAELYAEMCQTFDDESELNNADSDVMFRRWLVDAANDPEHTMHSSAKVLLEMLNTAFA